MMNNLNTGIPESFIKFNEYTKVDKNQEQNQLAFLLDKYN